MHICTLSVLHFLPQSNRPPIFTSMPTHLTPCEVLLSLLLGTPFSYTLSYLVFHLPMCSPNTHKSASDHNVVFDTFIMSPLHRGLYISVLSLHVVSDQIQLNSVPSSPLPPPQLKFPSRGSHRFIYICLSLKGHSTIISKLL